MMLGISDRERSMQYREKRDVEVILSARTLRRDLDSVRARGEATSNKGRAYDATRFYFVSIAAYCFTRSAPDARH